MYGGVNVSIVEKLKDNCSGYIKSLLKILTPLDYLEYVFKMLLVLNLRKVEMCLILSIVLNVTIMLSGLIFNIGIKPMGLITSCVFSFITYAGVTLFRRKKSKKSVTNYEVGEVRVVPIEVEDFEIPESLNRYRNIEDSNSGPIMPTSGANLNNLIAKNEMGTEPEVLSTRPVVLEPSGIDDLDLSDFTL